MRIRVDHITSYSYDEPVPFALQEIRLAPRPARAQRILHWNMAIDGGKAEVDFVDHHGNSVRLISIFPDAQHITVRCSGEVEVANTSGVSSDRTGYAPIWLYERTTALTEPGPGVRALVDKLEAPTADNEVPRMHQLSALVAEAVCYETGFTGVATTAEEALAIGRGVCQDHTHVFVAAARSLGVPARYVSGYLVMDGQVEQDATHAWAEVWLGGLGWVGFDVSNGISPDDRYVRAAVGLDYDEAAPVSGMRFGSATEHLTVQLQVQEVASSNQ